jgi:O-antigen ligase
MKTFLKKISDNKLWSNGSLSFYLALITVIIVPVNVRYLPPFMVIWCLCWIVENRYGMNLILRTKRSHLILLMFFLALYIWQFAGLLYSENPTAGLQNLSRRLSMVLFPLILLFPGEMIEQKGKSLVRIFAIATCLFIIYCFGFAFYRSIDFQDGLLTFNPHHSIYVWFNYFYGTYFAIFQHPSYLAMYVLFSVFIAFESFFDETLSKKIRSGWLLVSIMLLASIYFLSSRSAMLATLIMVPCYFFYKSRERKKIKYAWLIIIISLVIVTPIILKNNRINVMTNAISQKSVIEVVKDDERIIVWNAAFNIIRKNLIFGVGTGDVNAELLVENERMGNTELVENRINAHNQYIEVLLEDGLIGLIIFLSVIGTMAYIALSDKNLLYFVFIIIVSFFFLFETMLNRLAGVSFFAIFSFLLLHIKKSKT